MKKVAVLGLGRIGKIHLRNLIDYGSTIHPIAITSSESGKAFAKSNNIDAIYKTLEEALTKDEIDAFVLCSPSDTHFSYTKRLIEAGKSIFCEKPLDLSLERIEELENMAKVKGVLLMVAFNRRFDPNFAALKHNIQRGKIGFPQIVKITSRDPGLPPLDFIAHSGGIFLDMIIHDFDMARFLLADEVIEVFSKASVNIDPAIKAYGDFDTAVNILTFRKGTITIIDNSREAKYGYDQRIEVFGSKGMLKVENRHPISLDFYGNEGGLLSKPFDFFIDRYQDSYKIELKVFLNALHQVEMQEQLVGAEDAKKATQIALAAMQSVQEGRPIRLD